MYAREAHEYTYSMPPDRDIRYDVIGATVVAGEHGYVRVVGVAPKRPLALLLIGLVTLGAALIVVALRSGGSPRRDQVVAAAKGAVPTSISTSKTLFSDPCNQPLAGPKPDECYRTNVSPRAAITELKSAMRRAGFDNPHSRCIPAKLGKPHAVLCQVWSKRSGYYARFAFAAESAAGPAEGELWVSRRLYPPSDSSGGGGGLNGSPHDARRPYKARGEAGVNSADCLSISEQISRFAFCAVVTR
jgi:hypothetical protein